MAFCCPVCRAEFTEKRILTHHLKSQHGNLWSRHRHNQTFKRCDNYEYHQRTCLFKTTGTRSGKDLNIHSKKTKKDNVKYTCGALENTLVDYCLNLEDEQQDDIFAVLKDSLFQLKDNINEEVVKKRAIKFYVSLHINFHLGSDEEFKTEPPAVLNTEALEIFKSTNIDDILNNTCENLVSSIENFQQHGSGWVLDKLQKLDLRILEFNPLNATSYIQLPDELLRKKAIIDIQNKDDKSLLWSVIAGTYLIEVNFHNPQRPSPYREYEKEFNLCGISFSMALSEKSQNLKDRIIYQSLCVWVLEWKGRKLYTH